MFALPPSLRYGVVKDQRVVSPDSNPSTKICAAVDSVDWTRVLPLPRIEESKAAQRVGERSMGPIPEAKSSGSRRGSKSGWEWELGHGSGPGRGIAALEAVEENRRQGADENVHSETGGGLLLHGH